jgi:methionyl-tRNA formyltransferase
MPWTQQLDLVVLTCGSLGLDVASRLRQCQGVSRLTVVTTPYRRARRTLIGKVRHLYRMEGLPGFVALVKGKLDGNRARSQEVASLAATLERESHIAHLEFTDFHHLDCLAALSRLGADLGVVVGTYVLGEEVFAIPRMGCINLHCGKAPAYRGAAPGFWEMYNGEREVGITIHRVSARLDEGPILRQEVFPIDGAPAGDPLEYLDRYRREVLYPNGARMVVETVQALTEGGLAERPQDPALGRTYRSPDHRAVRELRRRVEQRRLCGAT